MNIQQTGGAGSWPEFVKLVQDARARSQGTGGSVSKNTRVQKGAQFVAPSRVQHHYGIMKNDPATASPAVQGLATKIAGSFFDAYA
jgi:hypothetical protein